MILSRQTEQVMPQPLVLHSQKIMLKLCGLYAYTCTMIFVFAIIRTPQCRSIPINADQNCAIDPNVDQKRSMPINADQTI